MADVRDPYRIQPFLDALAEVWSAYPDQRFGQLIINISSRGGYGFGDTWNWEDDEWLARIADFMKPSTVQDPGQTQGEEPDGPQEVERDQA